MRFATLPTAGLFMMAALTMARFGMPDTAQAQIGGTPSVGPQEIGEGSSAVAQLDAQLEQKLKQPATLIYDEIPWNEVQSELEKKFDINIVLDQSAIDDSLTSDEPIYSNLKNIPLEQGLIILLRQKNATFVIDHGVMLIISLDDAAEPTYLQMKMYDCRELLGKLDLKQSSNFPKPPSPLPRVGMPFCGFAPVISKQSGGTVPQVGDETGGSGPGVDGRSGGEMGSEDVGELGTGGRSLPVAATRIETNADLLVDVVQSLVEPDSWVQNGGTAVARIVNGILIVKHNRQGISAVDRLLQNLNFIINSKPGNAKFPVGADATAKEPTPGAVSNPEAQDEISTGATNDK